MKSICVFSSSSDAIDRAYFESARALGREIGRRKMSMIFGGGLVGLMGAVARGVHEEKGHVIGVIPKKLNRMGIVYESCDELIITTTMRERKAEMDRLADAFVTLPGGFGTLEEVAEVLTLKQLAYHDRPIVLLNTRNYFDAWQALFEQMFSEKFTRPEFRSLYHIANSVPEIFTHFAGYQPGKKPEKWL